MIIGLPKETKNGELRVGMTPEGVNALTKNKIGLLCEIIQD